MQHMLDPDDRDAARVDGLDRLDERLAFGIGQPARDLVQQQELWDGSPSRGPVSSRLRSGSDSPPPACWLSESVRSLKDDRACVSVPLLRFFASECARHQQVLEDRQLVEGLRDLKRPPDA
jgi:hypothetical protein